jgi:hypothetical protein
MRNQQMPRSSIIQQIKSGHPRSLKTKMEEVEEVTTKNTLTLVKTKK